MTTAGTHPFAITLDPGTSRAHHTGSWRSLRPIYVDRQPPCNSACPAGEDIQGWLYLAEEGRYEEAWRALVRDNPLPAVHGRVCYHPCEDSCNRGRLDQPVGIHAIERFLGDLALERGWQIETGAATGQRVLVVGAGPAGLAAAHHLRRMGHAVVVRDAGPQPGGMMRFGIPRYRLPREVLDGEIARIRGMGVEFQMGRQVDDVVAAMAEGFSACFLGIGAHIGRRTAVPGRDAGRLLDAVTFLRSVELRGGTELPRLGRRVAVYGGGNTAMDAARTARRLGAQETVIIYRRDREHMPAHDFEAQEALDEGVVIRWLRSIHYADAEQLLVEVMELDGQGQPRGTGVYEDLSADTVILALGQAPDTAFLGQVPGICLGSSGEIEVNPHLMTGHPGVFAGGDTVPGEHSVSVATGHGKRAAREIDAYLRGRSYQAPAPAEPATFERLNPWYYSDAPRSVQPVLEAARRQGFDEVVGGLREDTALFEARRCLSCGNCFSCDNCYGVCPDNAVLKLVPGEAGGRGYAIDYDFCKGCGVCAQECPCGAIEMVPEVP